MKQGFRQSMAWLHTWTGLIVGWVLFFVFVTGNLGRFDTEIDQWMRPEYTPAVVATPVEVAAAQTFLSNTYPDAKRWVVYPTTSRDSRHLRVQADVPPVEGVGPLIRHEHYLDPDTALPIDARATGGGQLLYKMHYALHYLPRSVTNWIVGICSLFMLIAVVSGVITHKKFFTDFFTFRPNKRQRSWLDIHALLAVLTLPFFFVITYTGLLFFVSTLMPAVVGAHYGFGDQGRQRFNDELAERVYRLPASQTPSTLSSLSYMVEYAEDTWGAMQVRSVEVLNPFDTHARVVVAKRYESPSRATHELVFDGVSGAHLDSISPTNSAVRTTYETVMGIHESLFAEWWLRWLFFLSGLAGAAIIGSGLILWSVKRAPKLLNTHKRYMLAITL